MKLRKAKNSDVFPIRNLINEMASRTDSDFKHGHMLARSLAELFEHVRDYTVLVDAEDRVLGCCALESQWDGLAELKAVAVHDSAQGQGWARRLVETAIEESSELGIECVYTLTNKPQIFGKLGFEPIDMRELPQRVWSECTRCPKFQVACDEIAMTFQGTKPKPTLLPVVGAQAPIEVQQIAQQLQQLHAGNGNGIANSASTRSASDVARGPMQSDGISPPFAPHPNHDSSTT
nr:N-Ac-Glu-synth: amino-acid [uncultured bacterium]